MANNPGAEKRIRQNNKRRVHNRQLRSRTRTLVKNAVTTISASDDVESAREATRVAVKNLDMAASKGIIHKRNADRRKSRLMKQLARLEAEQKNG